MTLTLVMALYQRAVLPYRVSPIVVLSALELELLMDQRLKGMKGFDVENSNQINEISPESRGNYFWQGTFLDGYTSVRGKLPKERYLETPNIFVGNVNGVYSTRYNSQIERRIAEKLAQFERTGESGTPTIDKTFSKQFANDRNWIVEQQLTIVEYLCETQDRYLQTGNPLDLEPITQQDVAEYIGYSTASVSRLVKNLSIQLPNSRIIFADELIPGANITIQKGTSALRQLMTDPILYENGIWKVVDRELIPILRKRFGIEAARRTVSKYREMLK